MYQLVTGCDVEPISIDELKYQLRIPLTTTSQDALLMNCIYAARAKAEQMTKRYLKVGDTTATYSEWKLYLDKFPLEGDRTINIYKCPVSQIVKIEYTDLDGDTQELSTSYYDSDIYNEPARIAEAYGYSWPSTRTMLNAVIVQFKCGYGLKNSIPDNIKQGILSIAAHLFENPADVVTGTQVNEIPESSTWLLRDSIIHQY